MSSCLCVRRRWDEAPRLASPAAMPKVWDLAGALPEVSVNPITGVGVVASRKRAPSGYCVVSQTTDGVHADLWKDCVFKSKVTRYLCYTRAFSKENSHLGNVLVDMRLIDAKDTLPVGFIAIQETIDTQERAFRKRRLCVKFIPRDSTETAICDVQVLGRSRVPPPQYTFVGELNSIQIWYGMGKVPKAHETKHDHPGGTWSEMQAPGPSRHSLTTPPACFHGKSAASPPIQQHCISLYATSAMDGVPFLISDKYMHVAACTLQPADILETTIKSLAEIEQEYEYSFHTEDVALAGLPSSEC
ncbi:multivesicular body subunit 12B-like isoform X1 [Paramormyrops kingsleyae]|uniref:Multivesicular body subunit 12B n=2 Tax=Paramormyrops kingsleyae TaxID=1676925 RepID=A0A3B3QUY9_9TELE|nr:multivesicular body subunit 12B-like isoform X1 [Paramormyrops kingsleyae]